MAIDNLIMSLVSTPDPLWPSHGPCGTRVDQHKMRVILARPDDASFPRDFSAQLPYCPRCRTTFGLESLVWTRSDRHPPPRPVACTPEGHFFKTGAQHCICGDAMIASVFRSTEDIPPDPNTTRCAICDGNHTTDDHEIAVGRLKAGIE